MKSIIFNSVLALVSILAMSSATFADRLYIDPFDIELGVTKEVSICLSNSQDVSAFQVEMMLPPGLVLVQENGEWMSLAARAADHSLVVNTTGQDGAKIVCFSNTNTPFSQNEGAIVNMRLRAVDGFTGGSISLTDIKLSDSSNKDILLENSATYVTGIIQVESISLSEGIIDLKIGQNWTLSANIYPGNATDQNVAWSSDNESVATVDPYGNVVAVGLGSAIINAYCGNASASCSVTVHPTEVESIWISNPEIQLKVGDTFVLTAIAYPEDATDRTIIWTSDNETVATVDANGNVTAAALGTATIIASCGNYSASCAVTVIATLVESIKLSQESWSGEEGQSLHIYATVLPADATDKTLSWSSSDESVATVDSDGTVSILKEGSCVITAAAVDGSGISADCIITGLSSVDAIFSEADSFDILNLNGILICKDAGRDILKTLTPGIYIIRQGSASRKIVIR